MKTKLLFIGIAVCMAILSACTENSSSSSDGGSDVDPLEELSINYTLLDLAYIYGHERNEIAESVDAYVGRGSAWDAKNAFGEPSCTEDFYDVCYMYNRMKDPYTRYYDPTLAQEILKELQESGEGIAIAGIESVPFDEVDVELQEVTAVDNKAQMLGIQVGDLYSMDDLMYAYESQDRHNIIDLSVARPFPGADPTLPVSVRYQVVNVKVAIKKVGTLPTVYLQYETNDLGDSIPVIKITEFDSKTIGNGGTYEEFAEALKKTEGAKSTIIDLRDNGGGDTEHCTAAAAEFLSAGDTLAIDIAADADSVLVEGKTKYIQKLDTEFVVSKADGSARDRYVVFLANEGSASCAELMLSAVVTNRGFPFVGQLTYGKQIAQGVITKAAGNDDDLGIIQAPSGLAVITAMYSYDKDWNTYHDLGIVPDFMIGSRKDQMAKAVELATAATYTRSAGYGRERLGHFAKTASGSKSGSSLKSMKMRYKIIH
jgi:C-terminal processing protease CtpA/Prc